ncbi:glycosyltransferase family 2 protein [uncultured Bacteroides sp.]|uniref:glycosyltransferase family 2 protein n=1 Tax=uncultured Bacteroides sp. TaxID=162156 RepID=UPI0026008231|nr:glycosyltransferase family 2 protein [uncultured Bacteroides sp.]
MKVSVVIPIYNVSKYIERCLLSVLNQTWQDLEIILVNDCTPDNSMEIVERVIASYSCAQYMKILVHEKNRGLSAARNTGIMEATGEYLYFLDSDDYIPERSIELLAKEAERNLSDFVIGNYEIAGNKRWAPPLSLDTGYYNGNAVIFSHYVHDKWYVMAWNKLVNRVFLQQNNLYFQEGVVHEDDLWSFKLACTAQSMFTVNQITYYYYMQPNSIMRAPSLRNLECRVLVLGYIFDFIRTSQNLQNNRYVYIFFETLKAKYFDRILYFSRDNSFCYRSYQIFREKKYISPIKAFLKFRLDFKLTLRNLHYILPARIGYYYFKVFVRLSYYLLIFRVKLKSIFHLE